MKIGRRRGRTLAFQALFAWDTGSSSVHDLQTFAWFNKDTQAAPDTNDFLFPRLLFLGTVDHIDEIDQTIEKHLHNWDLCRLNKIDKAILRLSTFCLLFQKDMPKPVVIAEAVNLADSFGSEDSHKFVNAVLDSIAQTV